MQRVALQFWHVGAARKKADREAQEEAASPASEVISAGNGQVSKPVVRQHTTARRGRHYHAGVTIQPRWIQSKYDTPHIDTC
jgi:hypothetical protein